MLLMIDNYDSFTYNLVQYIETLGTPVSVYFNDKITLQEIETRQPQAIIISPGPGRPEEAGISVDLIKKFAGHIPILGVCLGHQCIAQAFGGKITHSEKIMHGKTSLISHQNQGVFQNLKNPLSATRYHSLIVEEQTLPEALEITAWTSSPSKHKEIMGIKHRDYAVEGVQFHPESILSEQGHALLSNFLKYTTIAQ